MHSGITPVRVTQCGLHILPLLAAPLVARPLRGCSRETLYVHPTYSLSFNKIWKNILTLKYYLSA